MDRLRRTGIRGSFVSALCLSFCLFTAGCGTSEIGESCDDAGKEDECEDGAICTNADDGAKCRKLCEEQEDCGAGETCNGVSNTNLKSCQPEG